MGNGKLICTSSIVFLRVACRISDGVCDVEYRVLKERISIGYSLISTRGTSPGNSGIYMLDSAAQASFVKIYCSCGRIVDLDNNKMSLKKSLKKNMECTACRNARISKDIDSLNEHFDGLPSTENDPQY
jgi:hypothetical protein